MPYMIKTKQTLAVPPILQPALTGWIGGVMVYVPPIFVSEGAPQLEHAAAQKKIPNGRGGRGQPHQVNNSTFPRFIYMVAVALTLR